ncbi:MAG: CoA transferase [Gammaproteobacteria bacterium]|nr:CoA transferase [Gammaproteobacteria bacterium]MDE0365060.1 CoA transferase [Gammaproteobacteria bacterium]
MAYLLEGIRVVDAASFLAGPGAATVLADFGADVIKVEPPGGDGYRRLVGAYPVPYHWQLTSRNKRSIALDISRPEGQRILHRLVEGADVILTNFLENRLERYRMTYEEIRDINPRIVFGQLTGYGTEGPEVERKAFDITAWWARSGLMDFVRDQGQTPLHAAPGMGDHATAMSMFSAVMTGLYRRERTGLGCRVSTSLAANGVWANGMAVQGVIAGMDLGAYKQERGWKNPLTSAYPTSDGRFVTLAIVNPGREWPLLARALGHAEWLHPERFGDRLPLMKKRRALIAAITEVTERFTQKELMERLDAQGVTCGVVAPMGDVVHDEQLRASGVVIETGDAGEDYRYTVASPIDVAEERKRPPSRAPDIGAQTREIMREAGYSEETTNSLIASGVLVAAGE